MLAVDLFRRYGQGEGSAQVDAETGPCARRPGAIRGLMRLAHYNEREETMSKRCRHKATTERTIGYLYCCASKPWLCSGRAHGGVTHIETCRCGATRLTNSTGGYSETSGWVLPQEEKR